MRTGKSGADELFEVLLIVPSWVGPVLAAIAFPVLRYLVPAALSIWNDGQTNTGGAQLLPGLARTLAPTLSVVILVAWAAAQIKKWADGRRLDSTETIDDILRLSWHDFELLTAEAFRRKGFMVEETGSASGDGGVDLILHNGNEHAVVQCKQWRERQVGVKVVRELLGAMHDRSATRGIVICSGDFTREAQEFAERNAIELVRGNELQRLIQEVRSTAGQGQTIQQRKANAIKSQRPVVQASDAPVCPSCGSPMVARTAKKGRNPGEQFWGCPNYPRCTGTRRM